MVELFELGEFFVNALSSIGDFLLSDPVPISASIISGMVTALDTIGLHYGADLLSEYLTSDITLATLILGPSLIVLLFYRLIKFFTDIIF